MLLNIESVEFDRDAPIADLFIQLCDKSGDNFENKVAGYVLYNTNLVKI